MPCRSPTPGGWRVPILRTEAARGEGIEELAAKVAEHRAFIEEQGTLAQRRARNLRSEVLGLATTKAEGASKPQSRMIRTWWNS